MANSSISYSFISANCDIVKRQDELTYNVGYLSFIDECCYTELTTHNSGKANIECLIFSFLVSGTKTFEK